MKSISQVAKLTGVSIRTLQYYDEIGLLKPSQLTAAGYRMYDDDALQTLQQILFFKELGFPLKEIKEILEKPDFNRIAAFKKQKGLFLLKRNRLDRLIQLLNRLEKGEQSMSFKEFDLSDYINALEDFKSNQAETVIQHWGRIEKYTEEMKHNLEHFSEIMDDWYGQISEEMRTEDKFLKLASHKGEDAASKQVQSIVEEILSGALAAAPNLLIGSAENYCKIIMI